MIGRRVHVVHYLESLLPVWCTCDSAVSCPFGLYCPPSPPLSLTTLLAILLSLLSWIPAMAVGKLLVLAFCAVSALSAAFAGARPVTGAGFSVEGGVFCDTCRAGFETPASTVVAG